MNKMCLPVEDRIFSICKQYHNVISPLVNELEVMDEEYPIEIFNELRAVMTHVSRYRIKNNENEIELAEGHIKRCIRDCYKYMCVSIEEKITRFRFEYRKVDLALADNGRFLPELDRLESDAKDKYIDAKRAEINKEDIEELIYKRYEAAYISHVSAWNHIRISQEAILFASMHSKRREYVTWISIIVTLVSIVLAITAWI